VNALGIEHPDGRTAAQRWRGISWWWRTVIVVVATIVAVELVLAFVGGIVGSVPAGEGASSSFGTTPSGVAALAELLADHGHRVDRSTLPVSATDLPTGATLFVVDPDGWTGADTGAAARFVASGGHVVLAGRPPGDPLLVAAFGTREVPRWQRRGSGTAHAVGSDPVVDSISTVSTGEVGSLRAPGDTRPILAGSRLFAVSSHDISAGSPRAVLLASADPFTNAALASRDNAAFALNLAGPGSRPVVFDEFDHGYGRTGSGLAGLPDWWRWGLGLALGAVVVWMVSAARRFGPVEASSRPMIPARVGYVDALATVLAVLPERQLVETAGPVSAEARSLLCRRSGLPVTASDPEVLAAARAARIPDQVAVPVVGQTEASSDLVALGTALAWLEAHTGGRT
jgi:hypothetical protein